MRSWSHPHVFHERVVRVLISFRLNLLSAIQIRKFKITTVSIFNLDVSSLSFSALSDLLHDLLHRPVPHVSSRN